MRRPPGARVLKLDAGKLVAAAGEASVVWGREAACSPSWRLLAASGARLREAGQLLIPAMCRWRGVRSRFRYSLAGISWTFASWPWRK
jgi:hypothetical protein